MADNGTYYKAMCATCNKETWHYKPFESHNAVHCCVHSNNQVAGKATNSINKPKALATGKLDMTLWERGMQERKNRIPLEGPLWATVTEDLKQENPHPKDPSKTYCTHCGAEVDSLHTTSEKKPLIRYSQTVYRDVDDKLVIQETVVSQLQTINACPNCCLKIRKPITVRTV